MLVYPGVLFYGIKFESLTRLEVLVLHGFVTRRLAVELNCLWQVLLKATPVEEPVSDPLPST